jgi:hypothetical protein
VIESVVSAAISLRWQRANHGGLPEEVADAFEGVLRRFYNDVIAESRPRNPPTLSPVAVASQSIG